MVKRSHVKLQLPIPKRLEPEQLSAIYHRMKAGDKEAFDLFVCHYTRLAASILAEYNFGENWILIRNGDAEDVLQQLLLIACNKLKNGVGHDNFDAYIATSIRMALRRYFTKAAKRRKRFVSLSQVVLDNRVVKAPDQTVPELVMKAYSVAKAPKERAYIDLTLQGLSEAEIARTLECSRERVRQIKVLIRTRLESEGVSL